MCFLQLSFIHLPSLLALPSPFTNAEHSTFYAKMSETPPDPNPSVNSSDPRHHSLPHSTPAVSVNPSPDRPHHNSGASSVHWATTPGFPAPFQGHASSFRPPSPHPSATLMPIVKSTVENRSTILWFLVFDNKFSSVPTKGLAIIVVRNKISRVKSQNNGQEKLKKRRFYTNTVNLKCLGACSPRKIFGVYLGCFLKPRVLSNHHFLHTSSLRVVNNHGNFP